MSVCIHAKSIIENENKNSPCLAFQHTTTKNLNAWIGNDAFPVKLKCPHTVNSQNWTFTAALNISITHVNTKVEDFGMNYDTKFYLRCPTCISLAMLGAEKSTTTRLLGPRYGGFTPSTSKELSCFATNSWLRKMLINPGPAISVCTKVTQGNKGVTINWSSNNVWNCDTKL